MEMFSKQFRLELVTVLFIVIVSMAAWVCIELTANNQRRHMRTPEIKALARDVTIYRDIHNEWQREVAAAINGEVIE